MKIWEMTHLQRNMALLKKEGSVYVESKYELDALELELNSQNIKHTVEDARYEEYWVEIVDFEEKQINN